MAEFNSENMGDGRLARIARGEEFPNAATIGDMADEILRLRRFMRADTRRAQQIRRLRWAAENIIVKVESLAERLPVREELVPAMTQLDSLADDVKTLSMRVSALELDEQREKACG